MPESSQTLTSPGFISIVDDEPENLNVLEVSLSHAGYRVALFPRGELALAAAREAPPDLMLLDIRMPGMDGYEVCRRFKADEHLCQIPVIFISALAATKDIAAGFECGGVDYITKPFREPELLARVRTHIAMRRAYAKLDEQHVQLRALEHRRDMFVHMLVHDMRTPLQSICGHLQLAKASGEKKLDADTVADLSVAEYSSQILTRMVSTVIDISRMESGEIPLHRTVVPVQELFQAASIQVVNPACPRRISVQIADTCPPISCDADISARIVANLLANAIKHSSNDSEVIFSADLDHSVVKIRVQDRGPGIAAQYHKDIFDKFFTINQPSGIRLPATGLGLAFCKLAVEAQGGSIGIESELGQGSTFWFTLPAVSTSQSG
ncbi:MAG: response regulator [bacterium]